MTWPALKAAQELSFHPELINSEGAFTLIGAASMWRGGHDGGLLSRQACRLHSVLSHSQTLQVCMGMESVCLYRIRLRFSIKVTARATMQCFPPRVRQGPGPPGARGMWSMTKDTLRAREQT